MQKVKQVIKMIVKVVFTLLMVAALAFIVIRFIGKRQLDAQIVILRAKGEPVTIDDMLREKIPDDQNAAIIYEKIFRKMEDPLVNKDIELLISPSCESALDKDFEFLNNAQQTMRRNLWVITDIEEALKLPKCRYWRSSKDIIEPDYKIFIGMKNLIRVLSVYALLDVKVGKTDAAVYASELNLRFIESYKDTSSIILQLVHYSMTKVALQNLNMLMEKTDLNYDQAQRFFAILSGINLEARFKTATTGERAFFINAIRNKNIETGCLWPSKYTDYAICLRNSSRLNDLNEMTCIEAKMAGLLDIDKNIPFYAPCSRSVLPQYVDTTYSFYKISAEIACAQTALALCAYKDKFNSYPQSLKELQTKLGWKLPKDLFNGKDLIYKPQTKGYLIYSVGKNLKDDGGLLLNNGCDQSKGDIVWKMSH